MKTIKQILESQEEKRSIPVMEYMYGILSNTDGLQKIDESSVNRLFSKHHKNGFLILSANRSDKPEDTNKKNYRELINDVKKFGASYFPVYGGYRGKDDVVDSYEPSIVVTAFTPSKEIIDFDKMKKFAVEMCGKYDQDSVLVVAPNGNPEYIDREGKVCGKNGDGATKINDLSQEYFTAFKKQKDSKLFKGKKDGAERFTYDMEFEGLYCFPKPTTLNESARRNNYGEILNV